MGLFDLFRSRKARREQALLAEARGESLAVLRSAISTIGGERIAAGSDSQLAARSASLLTRHVMTPRSADDGAERLLAGLFARIAATHFSLEIGTNFESAWTQAVLEITGVVDRKDLGDIIDIYNELCADNDELTTTVRQFLADWMADPTQENLDRLGGLRLLLVRLMTDDGLGDFQQTTGSPPPAQRRTLLVNWDNRPAVIGEAGALAMLKPNSPWVEVNFRDVLWTARTLREAAWREHFKSFGELNPPMLLLDQISRSPRPREPIVRSAAAPSASAPQPPSPALPAGAAGESASAAPPDTKPYKRPTNLVNWDNRPAVIGAAGAFAMLRPNSPWVAVDFMDVWETADVLSEEAWRERFQRFGELNPPMLDQLSPSPGPLDPIVPSAAAPSASAPQQPSPTLPAGAVGETGSAAPPDTKPYRRPTLLVDWDHRPAIAGEGGAFAMLRPNSPWVEVDFVDVWWTAGVLPEEVWRERFKSFGELNPPMIDQLSPWPAPGPRSPGVHISYPSSKPETP